jgi:ribosomal protein S24E
MKTKIIKQEKNPFLEREELTIEIRAKSVPSASELLSELGKDEKLTVVKKIHTNFGRQIFLAEILIYNSVEAREKIETIPQKIKKKMAAEKKAADEAAKKAAEAEKKAAEEAKAAEAAAKAEAEKSEDTKEGPAPTNIENESVRVEEKSE